MSFKHAIFRIAFCSTDNEISRNSLFGSEIPWTILLVGVEIKLNVDEINKSCA